MFHRALVLVWSLCCWGALAVDEKSEGALAVDENSEEWYSLRLVGGDGRCRGQLQVQRSGQDWTGVGTAIIPLWFAHRVCAELDCGAALSVRGVPAPRREVFGLFSDNCEGTSMFHCFYFEKHISVFSLELNCSDSVRLVSGQTSCSGSLQIRDQSLNESWTSACEGALDRRGAEVLCRELGCGAPLLQGELSPLGQMFQCEGHESSLTNCPRNQTRTDPETCSTLYLTCSELRLVGGASLCEGTVEMMHRGEWRPLEPYGLGDLEAAVFVCQDLDCGSAVSTEQRGGFPSRDVWVTYSDCVKERAALRDCLFGGSSHHSGGLKVVCSGHQAASEDAGVQETESRPEGVTDAVFNTI